MGVLKRLKWLLLGGRYPISDPTVSALAEQMLEHEARMLEFQKSLWRIEKRQQRDNGGDPNPPDSSHTDKLTDQDTRTAILTAIPKGAELSASDIAKLGIIS